MMVISEEETRNVDYEHVDDIDRPIHMLPDRERSDWALKRYISRRATSIVVEFLSKDRQTSSEVNQDHRSKYRGALRQVPTVASPGFGARRGHITN